MHWLFFGAPPDLRAWEVRPSTPGVEIGARTGDLHGRYERVVAREESGPPQEVCRRLAAAILASDVFPPRLVMGVISRSPVQVGDAVGVWYHFVPGLDLFFAARVFETFDVEADGRWRCGFSYRTLRGHPACGEETFSVEKDLRTGRVQVALRSWSRPASWLARVSRPLMRHWQRQAALAALDHLEQIARGLDDVADGHGLPRRPREVRTNFLRGAGEW